MEKGCGDVVLQLDDSEPQCGYSQYLRPVHGAVPPELPHGRQAELVREMPPLIVVLPVLVLVQGIRVGGVLVVVHAILALLPQLEVIA